VFIAQTVPHAHGSRNRFDDSATDVPERDHPFRVTDPAVDGRTFAAVSTRSDARGG
jgi:hypothetical protein